MYTNKLTVDKAFYSKEVLLKTAYCFTDKAYLHLQQDQKNWIIEWENKKNTEITIKDFENELIAQTLREELINKTADIRKLVLARAFASTIIEESEKDENTQKQIITVEQDLDSETQDSVLKGWFET